MEVEISPGQRRKLELVASHRQASVVACSDLGGDRLLAVVRKS